MQYALTTGGLRQDVLESPSVHANIARSGCEAAIVAAVEAGMSPCSFFVYGAALNHDPNLVYRLSERFPPPNMPEWLLCHFVRAAVKSPEESLYSIRQLTTLFTWIAGQDVWLKAHAVLRQQAVCAFVGHAAYRGQLQFIQWLLTEGEAVLGPAPALMDQNYVVEGILEYGYWNGALTTFLDLRRYEEEDYTPPNSESDEESDTEDGGGSGGGSGVEPAAVHGNGGGEHQAANTAGSAVGQGGEETGDGTGDGAGAGDGGSGAKPAAVLSNGGGEHQAEDTAGSAVGQGGEETGGGTGHGDGGGGGGGGAVQNESEDEDGDDYWDRQLLTPLDLAIAGRHLEVAQWLREDPVRAAAHPFSEVSAEYAARPRGLRILQWLHSLGPAVCPWDTDEIVSAALSEGAYDELAWLRFDANLISQSTLAPLLNKSIHVQFQNGNAERCRQLRSRFGARLPISSVLDSLPRSGAITRLNLRCHESSLLSSSSSSLGSMDVTELSRACSQFLESRAPVKVTRKTWRKLHRGTCPCTCSASDMPDFGTDNQ